MLRLQIRNNRLNIPVPFLGEANFYSYVSRAVASVRFVMNADAARCHLPHPRCSRTWTLSSRLCSIIGARLCLWANPILFGSLCPNPPIAAFQTDLLRMTDMDRCTSCAMTCCLPVRCDGLRWLRAVCCVLYSNCDFPVQSLLKIYSPRLIDSSYADARSFLSKFQLKNSDQNSLFLMMPDDPSLWAEQASNLSCMWLKANVARWQYWVANTPPAPNQFGSLWEGLGAVGLAWSALTVLGGLLLLATRRNLFPLKAIHPLYAVIALVVCRGGHVCMCVVYVAHCVVVSAALQGAAFAIQIPIIFRVTEPQHFPPEYVIRHFTSELLQLLTASDMSRCVACSFGLTS